MENQKKTYVKYTNKRVKQIKKGLRLGTVRLKLAKSLSKEWEVPSNPVYQKIHKVASEMKPRKRKAKRIGAEVVKKVISVNEDTDGIELTGETLKIYNMLKREPSRIMLHKDHVRYYFN